MVRGQRNPLHFNLALRLRQARRAAGLSGVALSLRAGLARNAVLYIEKGGRLPRIDAIERLAAAMGLSPCALAYGSPGPPAVPQISRAAGVGARLKLARDRAGLHQKALGERSGTTGQSVANIESGEQMPGVDTCEALAAALSVSPCWLAYGDAEAQPEPSLGPAIIAPMALNEADTRAKLIDPALYRRGWTEDHIRREVTLGAIEILGGRPRRARGRSDEVLRVRVNAEATPVAVAIIEAKKETLPPGHGLDQAKAYAMAARHHVPFVYSTNGHRFVEFDRRSGLTSDERPMEEFPAPDELRARYEQGLGVSLAEPAAAALLIPYPAGAAECRYYQDAAIRAVLEELARCQKRGTAPRALLSLATGAGKTFIAVHLLRRLSEAGQLRRALFLCDRDELRSQAIRAFQAVFGADAQEVYEEDGRNNARNARVHIATYQTLGIDKEGDGSFLRRHYPPGSFSHIVIDECHRSAWGKWSEVLRQNGEAAQIGLTATPRSLDRDEDSAEAREDRAITSSNLRYFGPPVYEYGLAQAMEDGYLAACQIDLAQVSMDAAGLTAGEIIRRSPRDATTGRPVTVQEINDYYLKHDFETRLLLPDRVRAMCADLFNHLIASDPDSGPEQKTIIFCARDRHADDVAVELNNLYAAYCEARGVERKEPFAFKCTGASQGDATDLRGMPRSHFIATTVDLLTTGVDVPAVRNVVFFRYLKSPISFYQMLGRGTRIDEPSGKLLFRVYDYTAATRLFTQSFVTKERTEAEAEDSGKAREKRPDYQPRPLIRVDGFDVQVSPLGRYVVTSVGGRAMPVPLEDYRRGLAERLLKECPSIEQYRQRWIVAPERQEMLGALVSEGYSPAVLRMLQEMEDYDLFDVLGDLGYGLSPRTRHDRASAFRYKNEAWLSAMPLPAQSTLKAIARQFALGGTEGLESPQLWNTPEVKAAGGKKAILAVGDVLGMLTETKTRMFAA